MSTETPLTDADVARLVELADAATPGPWTWRVSEDRKWAEVWDDSDPLVPRALCQDDDNAAFIAAANPATIKALAARLDALHADLHIACAAAKANGRETFSLHAEKDDNWREAKRIERLLIEQRDAARAERDALRDAITALADELSQCARPCYCEHSKNARDILSRLSEAGEPRE